jgi:hypothetical protein
VVETFFTSLLVVMTVVITALAVLVVYKLYKGQS